MKRITTLLAVVFVMLAAGYMAAHAVPFNPAKVTGEVNINTATKDDLAKVPYVDEETADNIVNTRDISGPFSSPDDLLKVRGVDPELLDDIRPYLKVEGKTDLGIERGAH